MPVYCTYCTYIRGRRDRDRIIVGLLTTYVISADHH